MGLDVIVVVIVVAVVAMTDADLWSVSIGDDSTFTCARNGQPYTSQFVAAPDPQAVSTSSVPASVLSSFGIPLDSSTMSIASATGRRVFRVRHPDPGTPYVDYVALANESDTSAILVCQAVLLYGTSPVRCTMSPTGAVQFLAMNVTPAVAATFSIEPTAPTAVLNAALTVAADRAATIASVLASTSAIASSNGKRRDEATAATTAMWALVLVAMVGMAGQLAVFQTWLPRLKRFQSHPQLLYAFVNVVVINIVSWLGGFSAWALVTTVLCLVNIAVAIAYAIITRRHERRNAKHGAVVPDGTSQYGRYLEYNECPRPFSKRQRKGMIASTVVLVGAGAAFLLTLFVFWRIPPYKVLSRNLAGPVDEVQPKMVARASMLAYGLRGMAARLRMNDLFVIQTDLCGTGANDVLDDAGKQAYIGDAFVRAYNVDMSEYVMPDYRAYATLNDWFARRIRPELRPIYGASNPDVLVAAADARTLVFSSAPGTRMWLKGDQVSLGQLLGPSVDLALFSDSAPVIIHRLAPGDYHRFHAPSDATIVSQVVIPGPLYSVSADAMTAEDGAIYNHRMVMLLQDAKGRMIAYVALGATCVGSIVPSVGAGAHVAKGAELGYFQFGGSTIVVVLQSATPSAFISDLALAANQNVETLVRMGTPVAAW